ncbi:MAG: hypothetical protein KDK33_12100 [Leptospiraceae bacterium]|nr:hypothetical protein [Leptospiraceae bacterium]
MFSEYFARQSVELEQSLAKRLSARGTATLPGKEKDLRIYKEFYEYVRDLLPPSFSLGMGKVRSRKHVLNRTVDIIIFQKWCKRFLELTGGYVLADQIFAFGSLETDLETRHIYNHASITEAVKTLYAQDIGLGDTDLVPAYSILFAFKSSLPLLSHKKALEDIAVEKDIALNRETDLLCVLGQGIIVKDWENQGEFKVIETGEDTLMWFYILLLEYLDRDGNLGFDPRGYIKENKEYHEYS